MTQSKNSSLIQLTEVFPSWSQEDLLNALNEAGGDVYVAISRISEGHVSQWSDSTKKVAMPSSSNTFEARALRTDRNDRGNRREYQNNNTGNVNNNNSNGGTKDKVRNQRPRQTTAARVVPSASKPATTPKSATTSIDELSWGDSTGQVVPITVVAPVTTSLTNPIVPNRPAAKTSFADAAASALAEKPKKAKTPVPAKIEPEIVVKSEPEVVVVVEEAIATQEPAPIVVEVFVPEEPLVAEKSEPVAANFESVKTEALVVEEEEIVFMPARATPSLTMEQPAVVLPVRTNLRTNLTVRFGYDSTEEFAPPVVASVIEKPSSIDEIQPNKTPITVSALESTFAMLSTSPIPAAKSPEPILTSSSPEVTAWDSTRTSGFPTAAAAGSSTTSGYGNFSRGRQHGGWDYEPTAPATPNASNSAQSFGGPAPGFSGPSSPASAAPQRFVSRAAAQYEHATVYNPNVPTSGTSNTSNSRFSPYEETNAAGNNVSQYYTSRTAPQPSSGYPVYRGGNSFNPSRYNASSRPYYQQHHSPAPHHQQAATGQPQPGSTGHYSPYSHHQSYLNNYHHGYPQYPQHGGDQYSQPQQQQQPYYQPYQPPNQYLSNSNNNMHHHNHHHHQNQHNA